MWPCRDTPKYFTCRLMPPGGISALVSGGYYDALMYPRLASAPSLEVIHKSPLPKLSVCWLEAP